METSFLETAGAVALNRIFGHKPAIARKLISLCGSARAVFNLSGKELDAIFGPFGQYRSLISEELFRDAQMELEALEKEGCRFIHYGEDCYPALLRECPDAPVGLYVRSTTPPEELFSPLTVAIVGTRDSSSYGRSATESIVRSLADTGAKPCIISGFALGIDITAHLAALSNALPTIAVIPVGIDSVYPVRHAGIARRLVETPGCALVGDFPPGTLPVAYNFLRRNRIIAGLASATLLSESRIRGGGMMTARLAFNYGRDVYCVPGRMDDPRSAGCNLLVREKIAEALSRPSDLAEALGIAPAKGSGRRGTGLRSRLEAFFSQEEPSHLRLILDLATAIGSEPGSSADELCRRLGVPYAELSVALGELESGGFVSTDLLGRCRIIGY